MYNQYFFNFNIFYHHMHMYLNQVSCNFDLCTLTVSFQLSRKTFIELFLM